MSRPEGRLHAATVPTPAGRLTLLGRAGVLVAAGFAAPAALQDRLPAPLRQLPLVGGGLDGPQAAFAGYLAGDLAALDRVRVAQPGTAFRAAVQQSLRAVPAGTTISYAELARRAGAPTAVRAAAGACAANLLAVVVPCHRVVARDGSLHGYRYGLAVKEWLLGHERSALGRPAG